MTSLYPSKHSNRTRAVIREIEAAAFGISVGLGIVLWCAQDSISRVWRAAMGRGGARR